MTSRITTIEQARAVRAQIPDGPWGWYGYLGSQVHLVTRWGGQKYVMGFQRMGFQRAAPNFTTWTQDQLRRDHPDNFGCGTVMPLSYWVPETHDGRILRINHPVAEAIELLPDLVDFLLGQIAALHELADEVAFHQCDCPDSDFPIATKDHCYVCRFARLSPKWQAKQAEDLAAMEAHFRSEQEREAADAQAPDHPGIHSPLPQKGTPDEAQCQ